MRWTYDNLLYIKVPLCFKRPPLVHVTHTGACLCHDLCQADKTCNALQIAASILLKKWIKFSQKLLTSQE